MKLTLDKRAWWIGLQRVPPSTVLTPKGVGTMSGWVIGVLWLQLRRMSFKVDAVVMATTDGRCACPKCQAKRAAEARDN